jgi:anti-anti-sigma factor
MPPTSSTSLWEVSGTAWVRLSGELDVASAPGHGESLLRLARSRRLVLDARDLDFVDLAGIRMIEEVVRAAESRGRRVGLVMSPTLRRLAALDGHEWLLDRERAADDLLAEIGRERPVAVAAGAGSGDALPALLEQQMARSRAIAARCGELAARGRAATQSAQLTVDHVAECRARRIRARGD